MIRYNGIILDYLPNTLNKLVIKKSLASVENLSDRKGTSSYTFDLPRTQKNENAFNSLTTIGSQTEAFGDAEILVDNNVFQRGVLYVTGYNDNNFKCVFIGNDLDLIGRLKKIPLSEIFEYTFTTPYTNANFEDNIENLQVASDKGNNYTFHLNHPSYLFTDDDTEAKKISNWGYFFKAVDLVKGILNNQGYELESSILNTTDFTLLDYSDFNGHQALDIYADNNFAPSNDRDVFVLGAENVGNTQFDFQTDKYVALRNFSKIKVKAQIELTNSEDIESIEIYVSIKRGSGGILGDAIISSNIAFDSTGGLQDGINYFNFEAEADYLIDDYVQFEYRIVPKSGKSAPYAGLDVNVLQASFQTDVLEIGDKLWLGNYLGSINQFDFLKGILNDFNLVMDIENNVVKIELKDNGVRPISLTPIDGIESNVIDITDKVENEDVVEFDYINSGGVHLQQKFITTQRSNEIKVLEFQEFGSYIYRFNSFNNKGIQSIGSFFNTIYNYADLLLGLSLASVATIELQYKETWGNLLTWRYGWNDINNQTFGVTTLVDLSGDPITSLDVFILQGRFNRFSYTYNKLFKKTLELKRNNQIISIRLFDYAGNLMSFRNKYQIKNQTYKLLSYEYDVESKEVRAKLQLG